MPDHGGPGALPIVVPGGVLGGQPDQPGQPGPGLGRLLFVVGAFDGLHRGHAYLLAQLRSAAARRQARPAVITFDHHPDEILVGAAPPVLCDPAERLVRFGRAGVDVVVIQHFDAAVRMTPYTEFVEGLARSFDLAGFLMTPDAAFGHERRGTPTALAELGASAGFAVEVVEPFKLDGRPVRSTEIRSEIAAGELPAARRLLGRSVAVSGGWEPDDVGSGSRGRPGSGSLGGAGSGSGSRSGGGPRSGSRRWPGAGSGSGGARSWSVSFELPVALPPPGVYRVQVEPAWAPGQSRGGRPVPAVGLVGVEAGAAGLSLEVHRGVTLPAAERLRIRFITSA